MWVGGWVGGCGWVDRWEDGGGWVGGWVGGGVVLVVAVAGKGMGGGGLA